MKTIRLFFVIFTSIIAFHGLIAALPLSTTLHSRASEQGSSLSTGEQRLDEADAHEKQDLGMFPLKNEKKDHVPLLSKLSNKPPPYKSVRTDGPPKYADSEKDLIWRIAAQRAIDERKKFYKKSERNPHEKSPSVITEHSDHGSNTTGWDAW